MGEGLWRFVIQISNDELYPSHDPVDEKELNHPTEKEDVLVSLCAYTFIDTVKERLFHHRFLDPSNMEHKIYKYHDMRKYFDQI